MLSTTRQRTGPAVDSPSCIPAIVMTYPTGDSDIEEESVVLLSPSVSKSPTKLRRTTVSNHTISTYPAFGVEKGVGLGISYPHGPNSTSSQRAPGLWGFFKAMRGGVLFTIVIAVLIVLTLGMKDGAERGVDEWSAVKDILKYGVKVETQWTDFPPIKLTPVFDALDVTGDEAQEEEIAAAAAAVASEVAANEEAVEARVVSSTQRRSAKNSRRRGPARIEKSS